MAFNISAFSCWNQLRAVTSWLNSSIVYLGWFAFFKNAFNHVMLPQLAIVLKKVGVSVPVSHMVRPIYRDDMKKLTKYFVLFWTRIPPAFRWCKIYPVTCSKIIFYSRFNFVHYLRGQMLVPSLSRPHTEFWWRSSTSYILPLIDT